MELEPLAQDILKFWFGTLDKTGAVMPEKSKRWFQKDVAFDQDIARRFDEYLMPGVWGAFDRWLENDLGRVALIVLLDQFPRNIYRGQPKSFYFDQKALHLSRDCIQSKQFLKLATPYAYFTLMPTMHSELLEAQELGIESFKELLAVTDEGQKALISAALDYAIRHRDIVARFGRFPHRNEILGRESTAEEMDFLKEPGSSF